MAGVGCLLGDPESARTLIRNLATDSETPGGPGPPGSQVADTAAVGHWFNSSVLIMTAAPFSAPTRPSNSINVACGVIPR